MRPHSRIACRPPGSPASRRPARALPESADAFARGVRMGFAAGCLVQWRMLEYPVGDEMPL